MNFHESEAYLYSLGNEVEAMKLGLENITALLIALGEPQTNYLKVQVAGTNGKGSVCAFLDSICDEAEIRRGLYTSPHLISITERIKINGEDISEDELARLATVVRESAERLLSEGQLEYRPTFFEQVTTIALLAFAEAKVELAILETGLGGRYDAVTAANAEIAAITRIDLDHQEYLGDTIEEIAGEKAAIIRGDSTVCIGRQNPDAFEVITDRCREFGIVPATLQYSSFGPENEGAGFNMNGFRVGEVMLSLRGEHQIENAALAVLIAKGLARSFEISDEDIYTGLGHAVHPGRLEYVELDRLRVLLDGAHNTGGALALANYLRKRHPDTQIMLVYGSMKDKDFDSFLDALGPLAKDIILTQAGNTRSASPKKLEESASSLSGRIEVFQIPDVEAALDAAIQIADTYLAMSPKLVVVTGSLYLVGEVKRILHTRSSI